MYTDLHLHSEYSLKDAIGKIPQIVNRCKELGRTACAITDHGNAYGLVEFYNECKKQNIKPILGVEFYEAEGSRFNKEKTTNNKAYYHLIILVKNEIGYKNLCKLVTRSNTEGFYYKPRIDMELLEKYHEGLICMSACIGGKIPQDILSGNINKAKEDILKYKEIFKDDFYLEIQNHGIKEEIIVAQELYKLSKETDIKLICTNDCHYVNKEDSIAHEWMLCLERGTTIDNPDRTIYHGDFSIRPEGEMRALFPSIKEAFDNTQEIVDKCNFDFIYAQKPSDYRMPKVYTPEKYEDSTEDTKETKYYKYLKDLAYKGLEDKYPIGHNEREQALENLKYELEIIKNMGFAEYFLDTRKTIMWSNENNIIVGIGRGSGAGSTLNYCIGITGLDPIKYNLLFERFLNPERISMPDIDVDYCYTYKEDVVKSEADSNGYDKFCKIQTFITLQSKAVLKDCVRVAGLPVSVGVALSKCVSKDDKCLLDAYDKNPDLQDLIESDSKIKEVWNIALKLEGLKKSASTHACGHVPTPVPCEDLFPCSIDKETGYLICQYNMTDIEHLGNLKKDLLMLRNLDVIDVAHKEIKKRYGITVPLWTEEVLNDKDALSLFSKGDLNGVFQFESAGMKSFMKELKPDCFEDIIAGVSLYRPGPMDYIPNYIKGKQNPDNIYYLTPSLEPILKPTYGVIVYQEQVMQIVRSLAGFSMSRADIVRKAMGKKKIDIMEIEGKNFIYGNVELGIKGCINNEISEEVAQEIWNQMADFAKYAFNKSHAACYAAISMQTAYLKAHYPTEFYAGLLSSVMDKPDHFIPYMMECKKKGINILPPNINTSDLSFTVKSNETINYGLLSLKGLGREVVKTIIKERENGNYKGLTDFVERTGYGKGITEPLIKAGAFDFTKYTRATLLANCDFVKKSIDKKKKNNVEGQLSLFDLFNSDEDMLTGGNYDNFDNLPELSQIELLGYEKKITCNYLSAHPLEEYQYIIDGQEINGVDLIKDEDTECYKVKDGQNIDIILLIKNVRKIFTKRDNRPMAFLTCEDLTSDEISVTIFPDNYEYYKNILIEENIIKVTGGISISEDYGVSILANKIINGSDMERKIWIRVNNINEYSKNYIDSLISQYNCSNRDSLCIYDTKTAKTIAKPHSCETKDHLIKALKEKFGENNVKITFSKVKALTLGGL